MRWLLENIPQARKLADKGDLCFGTVDSWLIWKLTGEQVHATEISNASRTLVFNIEACEWDNEILARFGIPRETCLLYTSPSPRDAHESRMPSSA